MTLSCVCVTYSSLSSISHLHSALTLQLELFLSSGTVCMSIYSLIAGIFGMNIPYTWNDDHGYMFKWVSIENYNGNPVLLCEPFLF